MVTPGKNAGAKEGPEPSPTIWWMSGRALILLNKKIGRLAMRRYYLLLEKKQEKKKRMQKETVAEMLPMMMKKNVRLRKPSKNSRSAWQRKPGKSRVL